MDKKEQMKSVYALGYSHGSTKRWRQTEQKVHIKDSEYYQGVVDALRDRGDALELNQTSEELL